MDQPPKTMSRFDQALEAATALSPEDRPLLVRALLDRYYLFHEWPAVLFTGRNVEDVGLMILWLWLGLEREERADTLASLIERGVGAYVAPDRMLSLAHWITACLEDEPR